MPGRTQTNEQINSIGDGLDDSLLEPVRDLISTEFCILPNPESDPDEAVHIPATDLPLEDDLGDLVLKKYLEATNGYNPDKIGLLRRGTAEYQFHTQQLGAFERQAGRFRKQAILALPALLGIRELVLRDFPKAPSSADLLAGSSIEMDAANLHPLQLASVAGTENHDTFRTVNALVANTPAERRGMSKNLFNLYWSLLESEFDADLARRHINEAFRDPTVGPFDLAEMMMLFKISPKRYTYLEGPVDILDKLSLREQTAVAEKVLTFAVFNENDHLFRSFGKAYASLVPKKKSNMSDAELEAFMNLRGVFYGLQPQILQMIPNVSRRKQSYAKAPMKDRKIIEALFGGANESSVIPTLARSRGIDTAAPARRGQALGELLSNLNPKGLSELFLSQSPATVDRAARIIALGTGDIELIRSQQRSVDTAHAITLGFYGLLMVRHAKLLDIEPINTDMVVHATETLVGYQPNSVQESDAALLGELAMAIEFDAASPGGRTAYHRLTAQLKTPAGREKANALILAGMKSDSWWGDAASE